VTSIATLLPELAALPDRQESLERLRGAWMSTSDPDAFTETLRGALVFPRADPVVTLSLRFAAVVAAVDVDEELSGLWQRWGQLDLRNREALARAVARRAYTDAGMRRLLQDAVLERPEIGECLVALFLSDPFWFAEHAGPILAAYPHAKPAVRAAGQLLLAEHAARQPVDPHAESRTMLGQLLDYDAAEVFAKLDVMLNAAPQLGEPLIGEMAARDMDLRGVVVALRDRVERETIKAWLVAAVDDELERLVYMAML